MRDPWNWLLYGGSFLIFLTMGIAFWDVNSRFEQREQRDDNVAIYNATINQQCVDQGGVLLHTPRSWSDFRTNNSPEDDARAIDRMIPARDGDGNFLCIKTDVLIGLPQG